MVLNDVTITPVNTYLKSEFIKGYSNARVAFTAANCTLDTGETLAGGYVKSNGAMSLTNAAKLAVVNKDYLNVGNNTIECTAIGIKGNEISNLSVVNENPPAGVSNPVVDILKFYAYFSNAHESNQYIFSYNNGNWYCITNSTVITLGSSIASVGITYNGTPKQGDLIGFDYTSPSASTINKTIYVHEYHNPSISLSSYRCNVDGENDENGAYIKINAALDYSPVNSLNYPGIFIKYSVNNEAYLFIPEDFNTVIIDNNVSGNIGIVSASVNAGTLKTYTETNLNDITNLEFCYKITGTKWITPENVSLGSNLNALGITYVGSANEGDRLLISTRQHITKVIGPFDNNNDVKIVASTIDGLRNTDSKEATIHIAYIPENGIWGLCNAPSNLLLEDEIIHDVTYNSNLYVDYYSPKHHYARTKRTSNITSEQVTLLNTIGFDLVHNNSGSGAPRKFILYIKGNSMYDTSDKNHYWNSYIDVLRVAGSSYEYIIYVMRDYDYLVYKTAVFNDYGFLNGVATYTINLNNVQTSRYFTFNSDGQGRALFNINAFDNLRFIAQYNHNYTYYKYNYTFYELWYERFQATREPNGQKPGPWY